MSGAASRIAGRLAWFFLLYVGGVTVVGGVAFVLRMVLKA